MSTAKHPFIRAVDMVGGVRLAGALGITPQAVSKMRKLAETDPSYLVPSNHLRAIERATDGQVSISDLLVDTSAATARRAA